MIATAIAGGAALAATTTRRPALSDRSRRAALVVVLLYTAGALGVLAPVRRAQRLYDAARSAAEPFALLDRATAHDKSFPLYVARRAWATAPVRRTRPPPSRSAGSTRGLPAKRSAPPSARPGVAALWLAAGVLGADAGASWSSSALKRACDLDPMGALAPFRLMTIESSERAAALAGARALLAEPRLAAAIDWESRETVYRRALDEIESWPGVAIDWRRRAVPQLARVAGVSRRYHARVPPRARWRCADLAVALRLSPAAVADPARGDRARRRSPARAQSGLGCRARRHRVVGVSEERVRRRRAATAVAGTLMSALRPRAARARRARGLRPPPPG